MKATDYLLNQKLYNMRVLFIVQGEGRGHMTQALAMEQMLHRAGHEVVAIIVGTSKRREVPAYFKTRAKARLYSIQSPNFYYDGQSRSINLRKTIIYNLLALPKYVRELKKIHKLIKAAQPHTVINFYDLMGGAYFALFNPAVKRISIAHQYLARHPSFPFANDSLLQKRLFQLTNFATSINSHSTIALSFRDYPVAKGGFTVAPPLLRREIFEQKPHTGDYLLAYVVNKGYAQDLMQWHNQNKKVKIHCFWDNKDHGDEWSPRPGLTFHYINDRKFLTLMAGCMGYVSTAGFESICEAMYLGKPVMMVPVAQQYEQACNALDAARAGAGISSVKFDLGPFLNYLSTSRVEHNSFKAWVALYESILLKEVEGFIPDTRRKGFKLRFTLPKLSINNR
ncbi:MAG: glycosyltransferase family protein [Roseivirga sp.]